MKNRSAIVGALCVAGAAALVGGGVAAAGGDAHPAAAPPRAGATVFTVVERATTDAVVYVHKKSEDDVIGNTLGFGNRLYNAKNTKKVGRDQGSCYRTNPGKFWECTWTNVLPKGRISVQGVFPDSLADSRLAITGGTGAYAKAKGFMILHSRNKAGTAFDFEFHVM
jgi:Dirigent-like protein